MTPSDLSLDELTKFGIQPEDEGAHPFSPEHEWWNESWFLDWFDETGGRAGHVRIGLHPNQRRAFVWVLLYEHGEWLVVEEPRLALDALDVDALAYDGWGLQLAWERSDPLRSGRLTANGHGRIVTGERAGQVMPFEIDLAYRGVGAAHSMGPSDVPGHSAEGYTSNRFEQPVSFDGVMGIGGAQPFTGRGERDHSWGPRDWNIEWVFIVVGHDDFRLQCADVDLPGVGRITGGYILRDRSQSLTEVSPELTFGDDDLTNPVSGRLSLTAEDGTVLAGTIESVAGVEIDITHCFDPPRGTNYRRTLIRFTPDGGTAALGWLERNHFDGR
ncbi:MAG TPA: hypothetical protein VF441_04655 [Acidimicrobiia bacterium]